MSLPKPRRIARIELLQSNVGAGKSKSTENHSTDLVAVLLQTTLELLLLFEVVARRGLNDASDDAVPTFAITLVVAWVLDDGGDTSLDALHTSQWIELVGFEFAVGAFALQAAVPRFGNATASALLIASGAFELALRVLTRAGGQRLLGIQVCLSADEGFVLVRHQYCPQLIWSVSSSPSEMGDKLTLFCLGYKR